MISERAITRKRERMILIDFQIENNRGRVAWKEGGKALDIQGSKSTSFELLYPSKLGTQFNQSKMLIDAEYPKYFLIH